jgi:hypothetical protein
MVIRIVTYNKTDNSESKKPFRDLNRNGFFDEKMKSGTPQYKRGKWAL